VALTLFHRSRVYYKQGDVCVVARTKSRRGALGAPAGVAHGRLVFRMHPQSTPQALSVQERATLLALLPTAGRERPALRVQAGVIYARVSTDGQDSIPAQLDAGRAYAARYG